MKKENKDSSTPVRNFENEDYNRKDETSKGLATTHEQVSDLYKRGEVVSSKYDSTLPRNSRQKS